MADKVDGPLRFERAWRPLIGVGVLLAFGSQPIMAYISPLIVVALVLCLGVVYSIAYHNFHSDKGSTKVSESVGVVTLLLTITLVAVAVWQVTIVMIHLSEPCTKLRTQLLTKANSEAADTYSALHCPVFFDVLPFTLRK
jgi:glycerol-3-phosphate acyltransferase PlsY